MKNVIGLEKYREHQKRISELSKEVMKYRSENDDTSVMELIRNEENKKNLDRYFLLTILLVTLVVGTITSFLKIMEKTNLFWIDLVIYGLWGIAFIVLYTINKQKKKKIIAKREGLISKESEVIKNYENEQSKIYDIVVYIITLNDFYHELITESGEKLEEKWQILTQRVIEAINEDVKYDVCVQTYQNYFNEWLRKNEIYG